jgi:hypothetical protein
MKLKNRENQKYLQKHEVKISKTIKELWKEMHKLVLDCVFINIKIEKKGKKKPFCSNHPISIKSVSIQELTDLSKNLELFKMHQFNYSACSYTFI